MLWRVLFNLTMLYEAVHRYKMPNVQGLNWTHEGHAPCSRDAISSTQCLCVRQILL